MLKSQEKKECYIYITIRTIIIIINKYVHHIEIKYILKGFENNENQTKAYKQEPIVFF